MCLAIGLLAACAARKQEGPKYDMMENITARYNVVFHGRKIIDDVEKQGFAAHQDNYQHLLPVFVEPTEASASSNEQLMDSVIGKARNIINEKTKSKYINEAYLLTGRANYLKGNYYNAAEFFTYIANTFSDMPEYRQAALVWKARSLIQLGNLKEAGLVLDTAFLGLDSEKKSVGLAFATQAKHYLLTHDEESAIAMLQQALEHTSHKPTKLRWHFLLGQLLPKQGRTEEAYKHYSRVVRSNASYEMAFHAGLNRVFLVTEENTDGGDRVTLLRRMLRDDKNKEFKDQIYFQIAEVFYADGHIPEALANYGLSLRQEGNNRYQTSLSYLRLADHYFAEADYEAAKSYYDSTGMHLQLDFPDIATVQRKIANMDDLIAQLRVISWQDSLQYLMALPAGQRDAEIDSIISRTYAHTQEKKKTAARQTAQTARRSSFDDDIISPMGTYTDNRFYFNNRDAMGMGLSEFRRKWGNRELKDNWRFSDMIGGASASSIDTELADTVVLKGEVAEQDSAAWFQAQRENYLSELPDNEEKLAASHDKIHAALLQVGNLYRDEIRDHQEAVDTYEELLTRYPGSQDAALLYYNLFRLYTDIDEERAAYYKGKLLAEFPDALYSHIARDPMYLAKLEQQKQQLNQVYEGIYTSYTEQKYTDVITSVDEVLAEGHSRQQTLSQLAYLRALALGRVSTLDTFEFALKQIVEYFPDDSLVNPLAIQHLAYIELNRDTLSGRVIALQGIDEERERFVDEPAMTPWPQLVIQHGPEKPRPRMQLTVSSAGQTGISGVNKLGNVQGITQQQLAQQVKMAEVGENTYRNLELLPDSAIYYFVINVMNERVNLAPSRFGIGQFNRTRYPSAGISHQLKAVNAENQFGSGS